MSAVGCSRPAWRSTGNVSRSRPLTTTMGDAGDRSSPRFRARFRRRSNYRSTRPGYPTDIIRSGARVRCDRRQLDALWPGFNRRRQCRRSGPIQADLPGRGWRQAHSSSGDEGDPVRRDGIGARTNRRRYLASWVPRGAGGSVRGASHIRSARVRRSGRFRLRLRPRTSQLVRPILLAASGVPQLCGAPIRLRVRAGMKFAVAPKRLANGQSIRMSGRLLGLPMPDVDKSVVMQARAKGVSTWTTVSTLRVGRSGRFTFRYRFRRTFQRTTYEFRASLQNSGVTLMFGAGHVC